MDRKLIDNISKQIYRKFPEVDGSQPSLSERPDNQTLLIFKGSATTADGHTIQRVIRVVADANGKILRTTTSH
jgi:hypothetical protein